MTAAAGPGRDAAAEAFEALRERFRAAGFYERRPLRGVLEFAAGYALLLAAIPLLLGSEGVVLHGLALVLSSYGMVSVATSCHSASHGVLGRDGRLDLFLQRLGFTFSFGMSTCYWRHSHIVQHHHHPNVVGRDEDADLAPWFLLNRDELERSPRALRAYYRVQWLVFPLALAANLPSIQLTGLRFLLAQLRDPATRRREHLVDLAIVAAHFAVWLGIPLLLLGPGEGLLLYFGRMAGMGVGLFLVVGPHHYPAEAVWLDREAEAATSDPILRQTATCLNFRSGPLGTLLCHGADHQIEHHLFPDVPHLYYRRMQPHVEAFCRAHGYPYRCNGWLEGVVKAYLSIVRPPAVQRDLEALRAAPAAPP